MEGNKKDMIQLETKVKRCTKCGEIKSLDDFHNDSHKKSGKHSWCKPCKNGQTKS